MHTLPPKRLEATIEIACSPADVWSVLGDFEGVKSWAPGLSDAYRTTGPDIDVGSRRSVTYRHLFTMEQVVTEWNEGARLSYAVFRAPWPLRDFFETWTIMPTVVGSTVRAQVAYDLWSGPVGRLVNRAFTHQVLRFEMRRGLQGLKAAVEGGLPRRDGKRSSHSRAPTNRGTPRVS